MLRAFLLFFVAVVIVCWSRCDTVGRRKADGERMQEMKREFLATKDPLVLSRLERIATSDDSFRRCYALGTIGQIGPAAIGALNTILDALHSRDGFARRAAILALGEVTRGTDVAVVEMIDALKVGSGDVACFAAEALGEKGKLAAAALPALEVAANSNDPLVAPCAKQAIERISGSTQRHRRRVEAK